MRLCLCDQVAEAFQATLPCGECDGKGWVVCSFCEGQKVNVQARGNKMYRRCPECKAVRNNPLIDVSVLCIIIQYTALRTVLY